MSYLMSLEIVRDPASTKTRGLYSTMTCVALSPFLSWEPALLT
jgi:hypothetical protein